MSDEPKTPPPIREGDRTNFETIKRAHDAGDLCLVSAIRKSDGADALLMVAVGP